MRLLPVLLLVGCFDGATTHLSVDMKAGTAHVVQQLHNAWPGDVGCGAVGAEVPNPECVAGIRAFLDKAHGELEQGGATVARMGVVLADGELDFLYDYTAPIGAKALQDQALTLVWMEERTSAQVKAGKAGKRHAVLVAANAAPNANRVTVEGRYRRLTNAAEEDGFDVWILRGRSAAITSEWTYTPGPDNPKSPGAWVRERPGLEEALRASDLLVSEPAAAQ